jgi:hypothetical protein
MLALLQLMQVIADEPGFKRVKTATIARAALGGRAGAESVPRAIESQSVQNQRSADQGALVRYRP